jgi:hypothetical protein
MLSIFKSYTEKTSLLDDFNFYENRVKSLNSKSSKPATQQMEMYSNGNISVSFFSFLSNNDTITPRAKDHLFYEYFTQWQL